MPSTNKLSLISKRKRTGAWRMLRPGRKAQQLLFLCGIIASFALGGMIMIDSLRAGTGNAFADTQVSGSSSIITVNLTEGLAVRTLDSTATNAISSLDLELTPTPTGSFNKDTSIIDVATSNPSGYNLYMT
ncbi:hypothetical protein IJG78_04025, partial [Candidatus Saccharibacteria bacterium]|nr:hypothetical protein [Candidatus Saccharibacteria bacterium]